MSTNAIIFAVYGGVLAIGAFVLEWLSSHTHERTRRWRTFGFTYHEEKDKYVCPQGEDLWPHEFDQERRLVRYRAKAHICNGCTEKDRCTDSDRGREIVTPVDPWPHSEAGRFHRVISLSMVLLAVLVLLVGLARDFQPVSIAVFGVLLAVCGLSAWWLGKDLRSHPANAPALTSASGMRIATVDATGSAPRSKWASINRSIAENSEEGTL